MQCPACGSELSPGRSKCDQCDREIVRPTNSSGNPWPWLVAVLLLAGGGAAIYWFVV